MERNISPRIIVQGGAYSQMLGHLTNEYKRVAKESVKKGYEFLMVSISCKYYLYAVVGTLYTEKIGNKIIVYQNTKSSKIYETRN
jgi:hypothetical protein